MGLVGWAAVTITSIHVVLASVSIMWTSAVCMGLAWRGASSAGRACSMVAVTPTIAIILRKMVAEFIMAMLVGVPGTRGCTKTKDIQLPLAGGTLP